MGGRALTSMWPFFFTLLDICCKKGLYNTLTLGSGMAEGGNDEAAASKKISLKRVRSASADYCKHAGIVPFSAKARLPAASMRASVGVTLGFEIYLCLWNTVPETLAARVFSSKVSTHGSSRKKYQVFYPFLQCSVNVFLRLGLSCTRDSIPMGTNGASL